MSKQDEDEDSKFGGPLGLMDPGGCTQCKDCIYQHPNIDDPDDLDYKKVICMIYTFKVGIKPNSVLDDEGPCPYFESMEKFLKEHPK